jgi:hypothetical protein
MVKSFEVMQVQDFYTIPELTLLKGDTLVIRFNQDLWDLDEATILSENIARNFPNNKTLVIFNGMELGAIHEI